MIAPTPVAEVVELAKEYPARSGRQTIRALAGVSFSLAPGEVLGLLGPNRAGKTTLIKVLLSLCPPTSGRANRFGRPVADRQTLSRVGYLHETSAFPRYLTARQLLEYLGVLSLSSTAMLRQRIPSLLERVGLADRADERISRFSKGMIQRLALAQALVNLPDLLVLDEPNEGLDLIGRKLIGEIVREQAGLGRSVLMVSHVVSDAEKLFDRIAVLVEGRLVYLGRPSDLMADRPGAPLTFDDALGKLYAGHPA